MGFCAWSLCCCALLDELSNFEVISLGGGGKREVACCYALVVFLLSCDCWCSVSLPYGAVSWSAVCDCGISWSY